MKSTFDCMECAEEFVKMIGIYNFKLGYEIRCPKCKSTDVEFLGCDELNPTCGQCFLCEEKADDDKWWAVNRADVLQI